VRYTAEPRKTAGWEFFNDNVHVCDVVRPGGLAALKEGDRKVAEKFIGALRGCQRVLDVGCGSGFPGLYVASHVGELVGVDAAPNMVTAARANADQLGVQNAVFHVGGDSGLPFRDAEFDAALLCGVLESMDWESADRMMSEVWRVLTTGGRIALLDQDWRDVLLRKPLRAASILSAKGRFVLRVVERRSSPATERYTSYVVDPGSPTGRKLRSELGDRPQAPTSITPEDLDAEAVLDAWYEETAQFDVETLPHLAASKGFRGIQVESLPLWGQNILFLQAVKP